MKKTSDSLDVHTKRNWEKSPWYSSYEKNNYGDIFYGLIRVYKPKTVVELGTKAGYSAYHIARALKDNKKGRLDCYDLWEKYEFHSVPKSVAQENLNEFKTIVQLKQRDAIGVDMLYKKIDILHVDLSNKGEILEPVITQWIDKVEQLIILEGGSDEHAHLDWMVKYKKTPVKKWLQDFSNRRKDITYFTIEPSLSITLMNKKQIPKL